jgi:hypothetical protein
LLERPTESLPVELNHRLGQHGKRGIDYVHPISALDVTLTAWTRVHALRREGWADRRLIYDELPEAPVHALNLLR